MRTPKNLREESLFKRNALHIALGKPANRTIGQSHLYPLLNLVFYPDLGAFMQLYQNLRTQVGLGAEVGRLRKNNRLGLLCVSSLLVQRQTKTAHTQHHQQ